MFNVLLGAVGLAVLDAVLSRSGATSNVGGVLEGVGKAVEWFLSPTVPAFSNAGTATSSTSLAVETAASGSSAPAPTTTVPALAPVPSDLTGANESAQTQAQGGVV